MTPPLARLGEQCLDFYMRNSKPIHKIELKGKNKKKKKKRLCSYHITAVKGRLVFIAVFSCLEQNRFS